MAKKVPLSLLRFSGKDRGYGINRGQNVLLSVQAILDGAGAMSAIGYYPFTRVVMDDRDRSKVHPRNIRYMYSLFVGEILRPLGLCSQ